MDDMIHSLETLSGRRAAWWFRNLSTYFPVAKLAADGIVFRVNEYDAVATGDISFRVNETEGAVGSWTDISSGNHAAQGTGALQPGTGALNGLATRDFDGTDDIMTMPAAMQTTEGPFTLAIVTDRTSTATSDFPLGSEATGYLRYKAGAEIRINLGGNVDYTLAASVPTGLAVVIITRDSDNAMRIFVDGTESTSGEQTVAGACDLTHIGRGHTGNFFTGGIGEVVFWDRVMTTVQITALNTALQNKWTAAGVPVTWVDISDEGNDATAGVGDRPAVSTIHNRQALHFDGATDFYTIGTELVFAGPYSLAIAFTRDATGTVDPLLGGTDDVTIDNATTITVNGDAFTVAQQVEADKLSVLVVTRNADDEVRLFLDGLESTTGTVTNATTFTFDLIGNDGGASNWLDGTIGEVIVWDRFMYNHEINNTYQFLQGKWSSDPNASTGDVPSPIWTVPFTRAEHIARFTTTQTGGTSNRWNDQMQPYIHNLGTLNKRHHLKENHEYEFRFTLTLDADAATWLPLLHKDNSGEDQHGWLLFFQLHAVVDNDPDDEGQFPIALTILNNAVDEVPFFSFRHGGCHDLVGTSGATASTYTTWGLPAASTSYDFVIKYRLNSLGVDDGRVFVSMDGDTKIDSEVERNWFRTDQLHADGTRRPLKGPELLLYRAVVFDPPTVDVVLQFTDIEYRYKII